MFPIRFLILGAAALTALWACTRTPFATEQPRRPMVRLAELEIDATQLTAYLAALREEIDTSIRVEPGVLTLYAVQLEGEPTRVRLFEMYAEAHIASAHFRKYKAGTAAMVKSLNLLETVPLMLRTKPTDRLASFVDVQ